MESVQNSDLRQLCKALSEEQDASRIEVLIDKLLQALNERELLASLL